MARIVASAIKFTLPYGKYPIIMTGKRHSDIFLEMKHFDIRYDKNTAIQGFLTNNDQFVDRSEAAGIAWDAGQIDKEVDMLFSEDIWPEGE